LDESREALLVAALPVRRAAFHELRSGRAVPIEVVASAAGMSLKSVRRSAQDVVSVGMAEMDETTIIGMDGLTTRRHSTPSSSAASHFGPLTASLGLLRL
jgi:hypothetical protein